MRTSTWILLIAVVALGLYIYFFERGQDSTDRRREIARRVLRLDPARVHSLAIERENLQVALERRDDEWRLVRPSQARADAGAVSRLLDAIELLERSDVIRGREWRNKGMTLADFGLDSPRATITLASSDKTWTLLIGRDTAAGGRLYLKEQNDASIFVVPSTLLNDLPVTLDDLRDRRLFLGFPHEVTRIDLRRREGLLSLTRVEVGNWRLVQPWAGRAAPTAVQDLLDQLFSARIEEFVAESLDAAPLYGLDEPVAQASLAGPRRFGEQTILLGKAVVDNTNRIYASRAGENAVFAVSRSFLDVLQKKADTLRDRRVIPLSAYEIARLRIEDGERAVELARTDTGGWEMREPFRQPLDESRIQDLLADWTGLRIEEFLDGADPKAPEWGLEPPALSLTFSRRATSGEAGTARPADEDAIVQLSTLPPSNGLRVARLVHDNLVVLIGEGAAEIPMADPLAFRHPEVLAFDTNAVIRLSRLAGDTEETVTRDPASAEFRPATPGAQLELDHVAETISILSKLKAESFVGTAADAARYGLDNPSLELRIELSDDSAPVRSLLIGAGESGRVFAMLRGGDVIFTLPEAAREKLSRPLFKAAKPRKEMPVVPPAEASPPEVAP